MAALFSSGKVVHTRYWLSSTAEVFLGFVSELAKKVSKPVVIVLDNASIHRAAAIQLSLKRRSTEELEQAVDHVFANFDGMDF